MKLLKCSNKDMKLDLYTPSNISRLSLVLLIWAHNSKSCFNYLVFRLVRKWHPKVWKMKIWEFKTYFIMFYVPHFLIWRGTLTISVFNFGTIPLLVLCRYSLNCIANFKIYFAFVYLLPKCKISYSMKLIGTNLV